MQIRDQRIKRLLEEPDYLAKAIKELADLSHDRIKILEGNPVPAAVEWIRKQTGFQTVESQHAAFGKQSCYSNQKLVNYKQNASSY